VPGGRADLHLAQDAVADELLSREPFALLAGMLLDQQVPMEKAFAGPAVVAERLGTPGRLDPAAVAAADVEAFAALMARPPAVHRYPAAMAARLQALARTVLDTYAGDAAAVWADDATGPELLARLHGLPGFGDQKARIFLALLGKQLGVRPPGWREAAGIYGEDGVFLSVADVVGPESLQRVREAKRAAKAAARATGS
jgi:uncharacterized HhH-GPD family protein